ncbi:MAG TPA: diguanylate cyclase [Thermoleophilia bacterium]|nr:diguanylate cyclase [Thermoleophilia bacterium]
MSDPQTGGAEVLIAEDSLTQAERLRYFLEKNGFAVRSARNGREALEMAAEHTPAAVVSDIVMPEVDGYELCRRLRQDAATADTPVILLTALSESTDVINGLASGATDFLAKPYNEQSLVARLKRALTNAQLRRGKTDGDGVDVFFAGQKFVLESSSTQSVDFLLSSFEDAIEKNAQLNEANAQLKDALQKISSLETRYQKLMEFSPAALLVVGRDGVIWFANQAAEGLFRQDAEDLKGCEFPFPLDVGAGGEVELDLGAGARAVAELRVVETTWGDNEAYLVSMWDVTENVQLRQQLQELSVTDELTGLANRRGFLILAEQQRKLVRRGHSMVLLYMDLNDFKSINDTLGHNVGDEALVETAQILRTCVRESDILARMGGDEFAALLVDSEVAFAAMAPQRLQAAFDKRNDGAATPYRLSISCGSAPYLGDEPISLEDLVARADELMYENKQAMKAGHEGTMTGLG